MKTKKKSKSHAKRPKVVLKIRKRPAAEADRRGPEERKAMKTFTRMETGQPDQDRVPGSNNPAGAQGGLGPTNMEGEGDRQNDELAELEQIEPNL